MSRNVKVPQGYIGLGTRYFSIPFLLTLSFGILALIVLYAISLHPALVRRWHAMQNMPEFSIDSPYLAEFTGNARLVLPDGTLLYEGAVENAAAHGMGRLYENGALVYEGGFAANGFSGHGRLFDNGALIYEGNFEKNEITGVGKRYDNGLLIYEGDFTSGLYNGAGVEYENGDIVYSGGFAYGLRDGAGTEFQGGAVVYIGDFSAGLYSGVGKLYDQGGRLLYDGGFLAGLYDGNGRLYHNGVLLYDGEFAAGMYNGMGTEYNTATGYPVFSGKYLDNERMLAGVVYDENGEPVLPSGEPLPRPEPLSMLGMSYSDVLTYHTYAKVTIKEQTAENTLFVIDEEIGVIYSFRLMDGGMPDYLSRVYFYGLLSVDGIVVGVDISDIPGGTSAAVRMSSSELLVLGYSNALWGRDATAAKARGMTYAEDGYTVTAFYLPPEPPATVPPGVIDPEGEPPPAVQVTPPEPSGWILFLRIDYYYGK